jgi:hypothetical protein
MGRMVDAHPGRVSQPDDPAPYEPPTLVEIGTLLDLTASTSEPGPDPT